MDNRSRRFPHQHIVAGTCIMGVVLALLAVLLILGKTGALSYRAFHAEPAVSDTAASVSDSSTAQLYAESISFTLPAQYIAVGHSFEPELTVFPAATSPDTLRWASSDRTIASVDSSGRITACAPGSVYISARSGDVQHSLWLTVIDPGVVYLSPSSETHSRFAFGDTNESEQMTIIAGYCAERLEMCGVQVITADPDLNNIQRGAAAAEAGSDIYVALQANVEEVQTGTVAYYHNASHESLELAFRLFEKLAPLSPSSDPTGIVNGAYLKLGEIMYSYTANDVPGVILALESRYSREGTQWIVDNAQMIGYSAADAIMEYYAGF